MKPILEIENLTKVINGNKFTYERFTVWHSKGFFVSESYDIAMKFLLSI